MTIFLIAIIALCVLENIGKLIFLSEGDMKPRNPNHLAIDVMLNFGLIVWAFYLLIH